MIPALLLVLSAVVYRVAAALLIHSGQAIWLSNFAPLAAIALCGAAYFPPRFKFTVPLGALFISDLVLNYVYGATLLQMQMLGHYLALALVGWIGFAIQNRASFKTLLPASVLGSIIFYLVVNTFSWLSDPGYAKDFAGLIQAQTVGLPQYGSTPTWMFFRNTILSDLFFTLLFVACMNFGRKTSRARAEAALPRVA
ncbi:MAG TPA: DUF6580 family putative transport protein [Candidatus Udaeobacter sp.]|jgi:hypothetical protein